MPQAQSSAAVEYIDRISADGKTTPNECPVMTFSNLIVRAPVMLEL